MWVKIDMLVDLIDAGLLCWNADGTTNNLTKERLFTEELVADFGIVGVNKQTLRTDIHTAIMGWQENRYGYPPVQAPNRASLKALAESTRAMLVDRLRTTGITLPAGDNLTARILAFMETENVPAQVRPLRNYYRDCLRGNVASDGELPAFLAKDDGSPGVDPAKFATVKDRLDTATDTSAFKYLHAMFEVAYLDVLVRNL